MQMRTCGSILEVNFGGGPGDPVIATSRPNPPPPTATTVIESLLKERLVAERPAVADETYTKGP